MISALHCLVQPMGRSKRCGLIWMLADHEVGCVRFYMSVGYSLQNMEPNLHSQEE